MNFLHYRLRISALMIAIVLLGFRASTAQDTTALPPHVIDVQPLPGVELGSSEPLTIYFDQPMQPDRVDFHFEPQLDGDSTWINDRTLAFLPEEGIWLTGKRYRVTLTGTAANGLILDPAYEFEVQSPRGLSVAAVTPEDETEGIITEGAQISVTFDRPVIPLGGTMDADTLPNPLTFYPEIKGKGEWVNSSAYVFKSSAHLAGNTRYTATIAAGLTAVDGTVLPESFHWTFRTLAPQVIEVKATKIFKENSVMLGSGFEITFSQPMEREATEAAFTLEDYGNAAYEAYGQPIAVVEGGFRWNTQSTVLTFQPKERLKLDYRYVVNLAATARSAAGAAVLAAPLTQYFKTVGSPRPLRSYPQSNQTMYPGLQRVEFTFNTRMQTSSFEGLYTVSPQPKGEITPYVYDDHTLALEFEHEADVTYTITLLAGMKDIYGNATNEDYSTSYSVRLSNGRTRYGAALAVNSDFSLASAYNEEILLPLDVNGSPKITFSIYRTDLAAVMGMNHAWSNSYRYTQTNLYGYFDYEKGWQQTLPVWVQPENLIRSWTEVVKSQSDNTKVYVPLTLESGGTLPLGLYGIEMIAPSLYDGNEQKSGFLLAVTNTSITIKKTPDDTLAWVTDIASGQPVPNMSIQVWNAADLSVTRGTTDETGIFRIPHSDQTTYVVTQNDETLGVWFNSARPAQLTAESYLYTDRPIYRPGETVYFRGILRHKDDVTYTVPAVDTIPATATFGYGGGYYSEETPTPIYDTELTVTGDFGTFSGSFEIPDSASLGTYNLQVGSSCTYYAVACQAMGDTITFEVADFRVPEYEVDVTAQLPEIIQGDPLNALVSANYYFGAPVSNADVSWAVRSTNYYNSYFRYRGAERGFSFRDSGYNYGISNSEPVLLRTDEQGRNLFTNPVTLSSFNPVTAVIEATVHDESEQPVSGSTNVIIHPAAVYVGLRSKETFTTLGQPAMLDVLAVTPDSIHQPNQSIELEIVETRWSRGTIEFGQYRWKMEEIPVLTTSLITGKDGLAHYTFEAPTVGVFRVRAVTTDAQGRENRSEISVYIRAQDGKSTGQSFGDPFYYYIDCGFNDEYRRLKLTANQDSYVPGEVAEILIPNPYDEPVTALITAERQYVMLREVRQITGDSLIYQLPLTDAYSPTVYLNVLLMRGTSAENPNPDSVRGDIRLNVEPINHRLTIEVEPSEMVTKPGEMVDFDVRLTDSDGNPVVGEVGLALTDEAVLALRPANSGTLESTFYNTQPLRVTTSIGLSALLTVPDNTAQAGCGGGGGGDAGIEGSIRDDFEYTPLWSPHVVTDANGRATVSVEMPDNLTRWRLDARAVTTDTLVGQDQINIVSTLPLIIRPIAPRFFVVGDQLSLAAIINNNTEQPQVISVRIEANGVRIETPAEIMGLEIPAGGRVRVEWPVTVENAEGVDLTVFASSESGLADASKPALATGPNGTIPVFQYTAPETVATGGVLLDEGMRVEGISLPPRYSDVGGTVTIQVDPSLAAATVDSLGYLRNFPHQCIEQTVSRFYPNAVTYNALEALNLDDPELAKNLQTALDQGYDILLKGQNPEGGWGWFTGMDSNAYVTAYALLGLHEAQKSGYAVDANLLTNALNYLRTHLQRLSIQTQDWELNQQAFLLYVLAIYDKMTAARLDDLYEYRIKMSLAARSYLLMAYLEVAPEAAAVADLTSDLTSTVILSANGAHWEEKETDWYNWGSDTRTTALGLLALSRSQPDQPLLPNIVRWLMIARRGDRWQTTQETAWSVIALSEWMVKTDELQGHYNFNIQLNDDELVNREVVPKTVRTGETVQVSIGELLRDEINRLAIERETGSGALYYSILLNLELPADEVSAVSRGVQVDRAYSIGSSRQTVETAQVGDTVNVRVTINLPQDVYYFTLEDTLPAGLEIIDRNLLTTAQAGEDPNLQRLYIDDPYWYWRSWYFDRTELRDEGAVLYADYLPKGTYIYTYQARATTAGTFQTLPAQGYAFYQPEIFGRTDGTLFVVQP
ncbi:MAG: Ig-like domain-containing protein [Anaerolineae bacterium]|nr:Ig-like domain-containing protein [Anaerolineae bacterium]